MYADTGGDKTCQFECSKRTTGRVLHPNFESIGKCDRRLYEGLIFPSDMLLSQGATILTFVCPMVVVVVARTEDRSVRRFVTGRYDRKSLDMQTRIPVQVQSVRVKLSVSSGGVGHLFTLLSSFGS
jgi:hypothetical protein